MTCRQKLEDYVRFLTSGKNELIMWVVAPMKLRAL